MRLDYFVAHAAALSRRDARRHILAGRIQVEGLDNPRADSQLSGQSVWLNGQLLTLPGERYLMLHKPAGYVSSTSDHDGASVLQFLPVEVRRNLHLVGRLDADTTGLLLLTTDGAWSHRITSPKSDCPKCYQVTLVDDFSDQQKAQLEQGVLLKGEAKATLPAAVSVLSPRCIELQIQEGRYHQVKRMLAAVGNHVSGLHRVAIGSLRLPEDLAAGQWRALTVEEVALFAG